MYGHVIGCGARRYLYHGKLNLKLDSLRRNTVTGPAIHFFAPIGPRFQKSITAAAGCCFQMTRNEEEWLNSQEKRRRFMAETIQLALDLTEDLSDFDDDDKDDGSHDDQSVEMQQPSKQCFQKRESLSTSLSLQALLKVQASLLLVASLVLRARCSTSCHESSRQRRTS